ncbi:MAG: aminotransferase class V-fold PLP-dependent enzyme [Acidimicrobiales bacterium]
MLNESVQSEFAAGPGYLNTASVGLPPRVAVDAVRTRLSEWENGGCDPVSFDVEVERARGAYAEIVGTDLASVGIVGQASVVTGLVASSLPDGAKVVCAEEDFTSVLFPFLGDARLDVKLVPFAEIVDHIGPDTDLVAVSAVQSADGRVIDLDRLAKVAEDTETRTYLDVTQAAGWLPLGADRFDVTACGAYKWLCSPRGSGFITVASTNNWLQPKYAGWFSTEDPWTSIYGPPLRLASDARRFNVSPAWFDFVGAASALEFIASLGVDEVNDHSVTLANAFRSAMSMTPSNSAIVSLATPHGAVLAEAGISSAERAGRVRLSFYLYNTLADAERAAELLR